MAQQHHQHAHLHLPHLHLPHQLHHESSPYHRVDSPDGVEPVTTSSDATGDDSYYSSSASGSGVTVSHVTSYGTSSISVDSGIYAGGRRRAQKTESQTTLPTAVSGINDDDGCDGKDPSSASEDASGCCCGNCCRGMALRCRSMAAGGREFLQEIGDMIGKLQVRRKAKQLFRLKTIKDRLPIAKWLPKYRLVCWSALWIWSLLWEWMYKSSSWNA